jgi:hypothetical protein
MTALIQVKPGLDWSASGGLFDWTLEFLSERLSDTETADWLRTVVEDNLGSVWFHEFPPATQEEIARILRSDLLDAARKELPERPGKAGALEKLEELVHLTDAAPP